MDKITLIFLSILTLPAVAKEPVRYDYPVLRVIDGDTLSFKADFLPAPLKPELHLRVYGVDTPEKGSKAKCKSEADRSDAATAFVKEIVAKSKTQQIELRSWDKYGGRVLGDVILDGISLRKLLIDKQYAREYYGAAKQSWCQ